MGRAARASAVASKRRERRGKGGGGGRCWRSPSLVTCSLRKDNTWSIQPWTQWCYVITFCVLRTSLRGLHSIQTPQILTPLAADKHECIKKKWGKGLG